MKDNSSYDYIIVGGGTAGAVIASRLSQCLPECSIALVEAGPHAKDDSSLNDPTAMPELLQRGLIVDYSTTPQTHLNHREILNPAGRLLSGSSAVNVGVWMRTSNTDFDIIAQKAGHERFRFNNLLPYFKKCESWWNPDADPVTHGFNGPVNTIGGRKYPLREILRTSYGRLGYHFNSNPEDGDPSGLVELTQSFLATSPSTSTRQHSSLCYDLSNVHVICESLVARISFDSSKRANGIELLSGEKLAARKEIVVSCGAQKTPQLLLLSGIGPRGELSGNDIPVVADSPQVGRNLFDHSALIMYFKLKSPDEGLIVPFNANTIRPEFGQGMAWDWHAFGNISPHDLLLALEEDGEPGVKDRSHPILQDRRCHILTIAHYFPVLATPDYNPAIRMTDGAHLALTALHLLPISRGTISLKSSSPKDEPVIDPKYLSTNTDRFVLRYAVRQILALTETSPFADQISGETPPAHWPALTTKSSDNDIDARIRAFTGTIAHPMGTCALGTVLDDEFKVKGVQGLRVCDASVFPEPVGGMPQATVYAIAELCADLVASNSQ